MLLLFVIFLFFSLTNARFRSDTLPGDFAVWAASKEARFLHGRLVWSGWDVEELKAMEGFKDVGFCRIGLQGPPAVSADGLFAQMTALRARGG